MTLRSSWLTPLSVAALQRPLDDHQGDKPAFKPDLGKIARESVRGVVTLGASVGSGVALYRRALLHAAAGNLPAPCVPGLAVVPAVGVGASAVVDALSVQWLGKPTDPDCRSVNGLQWLSPAANAVALAAYRYAPFAKPRVGSVPDLAAHVLLTAAGGGVAYSTREWLVQQASAKRRRPLSSRAGVSANIPDRVIARAATQLASTALRFRALAQPEEAAKLYLPVLLASCVPYGWREDLARQIARLRTQNAPVSPR